MHPVFIEVFGRPIYWYGVLTATGFLAAVINWSMLGRQDNRPKGVGSELGVWIMVGGILGARVAYVVANWPEYMAAPLQIFRIDQGGLIYYGGLIGGSIAIVLMAWIRREPLWSFSDFVVTSVPLGHAIGRIGCFLNGCCFGKVCQFPWAIYHEHAFRHPTPLYESAYNLVIYFVLILLYRIRAHRSGSVFSMYLVLYSLGRFLFEYTRGDDRMRWLGLTVAQDISLALFIAGCFLLIVLPRERTRVDG